MPLRDSELADISFGLRPTSVLIKKSHRVRIAIAGHDDNNFARIPARATPTITIMRTARHASFIELPAHGQVSLDRESGFDARFGDARCPIHVLSRH
jgi:hypothetical protein